jgi:hypothetical protein
MFCLVLPGLTLTVSFPGLRCLSRMTLAFRPPPDYGSGAWGVDDCRSGSRRGKVAEYLADGVVAELLADARCTTISGLGMSHPICYE